MSVFLSVAMPVFWDVVLKLVGLSELDEALFWVIDDYFAFD